MQRQLTSLDRLITTLDTALREVTRGTNTLSGDRPSPAKDHTEAELTDTERQHAGGLMRINHTGEVCAQALYRGQALVAKSDETREALLHAAQEEKDHLDWCEERLQELGSHTSRLNPLFFVSSYALGAITGTIGDKVSLGFVHATEEGVAAHLKSICKNSPKTTESRSWFFSKCWPRKSDMVHMRLSKVEANFQPRLSASCAPPAK